jgi:hypothetical protein
MMRQGSTNGRRPRGRTNSKQQGGGGPSRTHTFDSNGPDGRVRGNARQVYEKYLTLARDATTAGDRIAAEVYHQYAEHYYRILGESGELQASGRQGEDGQQPQHAGHDARHDGDYDDDDDSPPAGRNTAPPARGPQSNAPQSNAPQSNAPQSNAPRANAPRHNAPQFNAPRPHGSSPNGPGSNGPASNGPGPNAPVANRDGNSGPEAAAPVERAAAQPVVSAEAAGQIAEGDAPPRARRGRPRKPRVSEEDKPAKPEAESDPVGT